MNNETEKMYTKTQVLKAIQIAKMQGWDLCLDDMGMCTNPKEKLSDLEILENIVNEFKVGEVVVYCNKRPYEGIPSYELGIVKEVLPNNEYKVYYNSLDASTLTHEEHLGKITNIGSFSIKEKSLL